MGKYITFLFVFLISGVFSVHIVYADIPSNGTYLGNDAYAVNGYAVTMINDGSYMSYYANNDGRIPNCFAIGGAAAVGTSVNISAKQFCGLNNKKCGNQVYVTNLGPACTYMSKSIGNYCSGNSVYTTDSSCNTLKVKDCSEYCNNGACVSSLKAGSCTGIPFNANRGYKGVKWSVSGVSGASENYTYNWSAPSCVDQQTYSKSQTNSLFGKNSSFGSRYAPAYLGFGSSATCYYPSLGSNSPSAIVTVNSAATANIPQQTVQISCVYDTCYGSSDPSCKKTTATTTQTAVSTTNQTSSASTTTGSVSCGSEQISCGGSCVDPINGQCPSDLGVILMAAKTGSNIFKMNSLVVSKDAKIDLKWEASSSIGSVICNAVNGWDSSTSSYHTTLSPIVIPSSRDFSVSCTDGIKTLIDTIRVLVVGVSEF